MHVGLGRGSSHHPGLQRQYRQLGNGPLTTSLGNATTVPGRSEAVPGCAEPGMQTFDVETAVEYWLSTGNNHGFKINNLTTGVDGLRGFAALDNPRFPGPVLRIDGYGYRSQQYGPESTYNWERMPWPSPPAGSSGLDSTI